MTYPTIARGSKIGIHQQMGGPGLQFIRDAAARGAPIPIFKSVDHNGNCVECKRASPSTIVVSRSTRSDIEACPNMDALPPDEYLRWLANTMADYVVGKTNAEERAAIDYFEFWNEPRPHTIAGYERLTRLMWFTCDAAEARGIKAALFSLNAGTPEWDEIIAILQTGIMARMAAGHHISAAHEGLLPYPGFDRNTPILAGLGSPINNPYTGTASPRFPDAGYLCLRYRFWIHAAQQVGVQLAPFFVSEFYPSVHRPLGDLDIVDIRNRYAAYDNEIAKDSLCLGVTPFTLGGGGGWGHEDHANFYPALVDYAVSVAARINGSPAPIPPGDGATHVVTATLLNVRAHPYTITAPPLVKQLQQGARVKVEGIYKTASMTTGWACISPNSNEWVSMLYLAGL